ncbi:MAG: hypothetical protein JXR41_06280 [Bacteroidales bacterium]|nr:hypothetical protein [Bacteroidales bacterium]MBN2762678.1 hypothetical protein [Bacteroidales bacterium]
MEEQHSTAGQGLGIAGLIMGVLAIPLGIIPCTFFIALVFGAIGIVLSAIALTQANRGNGPKGLIISALVCSILGFSFAFLWGITLKNTSPIIKTIIKEIKEDGDLEEIFEDLGEDTEEILQDLEKAEEEIEKDECFDEREKALEDTLKALEGVE